MLCPNPDPSKTEGSGTRKFDGVHLGRVEGCATLYDVVGSGRAASHNYRVCASYGTSNVVGTFRAH